MINGWKRDHLGLATLLDWLTPVGKYWRDRLQIPLTEHLFDLVWVELDSSNEWIQQDRCKL
jgi:hypothetical protein